MSTGHPSACEGTLMATAEATVTTEKKRKRPDPIVLSYNYLTRTAAAIASSGHVALMETTFNILDLWRIIGEYAYEPRLPHVHLLSPDELKANPFRLYAAVQAGSVWYGVEKMDPSSYNAFIRRSTGTERLRVVDHTHVIAVNRVHSRLATYPLRVDGVSYILDSSLFTSGVQPTFTSESELTLHEANDSKQRGTSIGMFDYPSTCIPPTLLSVKAFDHPAMNDFMMTYPVGDFRVTIGNGRFDFFSQNPRSTYYTELWIRYRNGQLKEAWRMHWKDGDAAHVNPTDGCARFNGFRMADMATH